MELGKIIIFFLLLLSNPICAQEKKLTELRDNYCGNDCEFYHENLKFRKALLNLPPAPPKPRAQEDSLIFFSRYH